jgi:hypothetical protein
VWQWNIKKVCDHLHGAYTASFENWGKFLARREFIPDFLQDFAFTWDKAGDRVSLSAGEYSVSVNADVFSWTDSSELSITPDYYSLGGKVEFGIRKIVLQRDVRGNDYAAIYKEIKLDPRLEEQADEDWEDVVSGKFPFNGTPVINPYENRGVIGALFPAAAPHPDVRYRLYLAMDSPGSEAGLSRRLDAFRRGLRIR